VGGRADRLTYTAFEIAGRRRDLGIVAEKQHPAKKLVRVSAAVQRIIEQQSRFRVFPGEDALLRLVSAVLVEIDEKWASDTKAYIKWECQDA